MRKNPKRFQLNRETMRRLDFSSVVGGGEDEWSSSDDPVSRGFTNCTYCNGRTKWRTDCTQI